MLMFCLIAGVYEEQAVRKLGPFLFLFKISQGETYGFDVFFFFAGVSLIGHKEDRFG